MSLDTLVAIRDELHHFLEATGSDAHLYPDRVWAPTAKKLADKFALELARIFRRQADEYASRIPATAGVVKEADIPIPAWVEAKIFTDDKDWQKELASIQLPVTAKAMEQGALETAAEYDIKINFEVGDPRTAGILRDNTIEFSREVQQTTHDAVVMALADSTEAGESIYEMREKIKRLPEFDPYRAEMVARTEVLSAMNAGDLGSYRLMGAAGKKWKAAHDSRTRESHRKADGQVRYVDEPFRVGGEDLKHPGDGSAKNRINCRCTMVPVFDKEAVDKARGSWDEEKAGKAWEDERKEKAARTKARLENQRARQEEYLKKHGGKHAGGARAAQASGKGKKPSPPKGLVEKARQMVGKQLDEAEPVLAKIKNKECAYIARPDGEVFEFIEGQHGSITIPDGLDLEGNILSHNHHVKVADGGVRTLSPDDVFGACQCRLAEVRAVTPDGMLYSMKAPAGGWDTDYYWNVIELAAQGAARQAEQEALQLVQHGAIMNAAEFEDWVFDRAWELIAQWASLTYSRSTL